MTKEPTKEKVMTTTTDSFQKIIDAGEVLTRHPNGEPKQVISRIKVTSHNDTLALLHPDGEVWQVELPRDDDSAVKQKWIELFYHPDRTLKRIDFFRPDRTLKRMEIFYLGDTVKSKEFSYRLDGTAKWAKIFRPDDGRLEAKVFFHRDETVKKLKTYNPDGTLEHTYHNDIEEVPEPENTKA